MNLFINQHKKKTSEIEIVSVIILFGMVVVYKLKKDALIKIPNDLASLFIRNLQYKSFT